MMQSSVPVSTICFFSGTRCVELKGGRFNFDIGHNFPNLTLLNGYVVDSGFCSETDQLGPRIVLVPVGLDRAPAVQSELSRCLQVSHPCQIVNKQVVLPEQLVGAAEQCLDKSGRFAICGNFQCVTIWKAIEWQEFCRKYNQLFDYFTDVTLSHPSG